jgi:hypothetical protein
MALPKENWEYAEKMRLIDLKMREAEKATLQQLKYLPRPSYEATFYGITLGGTGAPGATPAGGIGSGTSSGCWVSYPPAPTPSTGISGYPSSSYSGYYDPPPEPMVPISELYALEARIKLLEKDLSERDEVIEALVADMEDIEVLREENARLKIISVLRQKPETETRAFTGEWIKWDGGPMPVPKHVIVAVELDGMKETSTFQPAGNWNWQRGAFITPITAYRVINAA